MARALLAILLLALLPLASQGIVIRHDKADSRYRVDDSRYPQVFYLHTSFSHKVCVATLVAPHWAITAAHCARETPLGETLAGHENYPVTIARQDYTVTELVLHPRANTGDELTDVDMALLRLDHDVRFIPPALLNQDSDENGKVYTLLGWGYTGIGTQGMQSNDGELRRAENRVEAAGQWLEFRFDDPREVNSQALDLEGVPGLGDSGGPALQEVGDDLVVVGIAVGELEEGASPEHQGLYGAVQLYERISGHLDWIESIISD